MCGVLDDGSATTTTTTTTKLTTICRHHHPLNNCIVTGAKWNSRFVQTTRVENGCCLAARTGNVAAAGWREQCGRCADYCYIVDIVDIIVIDVIIIVIVHHGSCFDGQRHCCCSVVADNGVTCITHAYIDHYYQ